jgi:hypothetical protein
MLLISQLFAAARTWRQEFVADSSIALYIMLWTGGSDVVPGVGAVDTVQLSDEQKAQLTIGQILGTYTLEQAQAWLVHLVADLHFDEGFVVGAVARAIDEELETQAEEYGQSRARLRETARELDALLNDPAALARYNALRQRNPLRIAGLPDLGDVTVRDLRELLGRVRQESGASLDEQQERQRRWQRWRELTAPSVR